MPTPHKFQNFFSLVPNPNNKSNAKAVCIFCSSKNGGVQAAALIPGCYNMFIFTLIFIIKLY